MPMAIVDSISARIRSHQKRLIPVAVEQRRQGMRLVVIVEKDFCVIAEAAGMPELADLENVIDVCCFVTQELARHVTARALFDIFAIFLAYPAHAADIFIENGGKFSTAVARSVDIIA